MQRITERRNCCNSSSGIHLRHEKQDLSPNYLYTGIPGRHRKRFQLFPFFFMTC